MLPKLHGDTLYLPVADGVYLQSNQQSLRLKGQDLYQWIEALEPYLNGRFRLETIVGDLPPEHQAMVREIVEALSTHGFLKDLSGDRPHSLDEQELSTYAAEIAFLESFRDSAAATFEQFRAQRVLLIGSGLTILALAHATLQGGTRSTTVWVTDECETVTQRFEAYREQAHARDPQQVLLRQPAPDWHNMAALQEALQPFDVILHVSDRPMLQRALTLNRLCVELQKPFFQALIVDDQALIGPWVRPGQAGCWECAWRRWLANLEAPRKNARDPWQDDLTTPISSLLGLPIAATVANMLGFEAFKALTEAGPSGINGTLMALDLEMLRGQSHHFLPHPLCQSCQHPASATEATFLAQIHALEELEPRDPETFNQQAVSCFDAALGIFGYLGEDDLVQMPLNVSSLTVSAPMTPDISQEPLTLTCARLGTDTARHQVTLQAAARYASRLLDRRRLVADAAGTQAWAYDLFTRQACLLPVEQAYPPDDLQTTAPTPQGVSAGLSWAEACTRALLDHCLALTLQEVHLEEVRYPEISPETLPLDEQSNHLLRLIEQTGKSLQIYDVTGTLRVPTLAFCLGEDTLVYTTQLDVRQALHDGLEQVVQHAQALHEEQMMYALPPVPQLPRAVRGAPGVLPASAAPNSWQEQLEQLVATLHQHHWRLLALPLDHDPALTDILPFLVRVLVIPQENTHGH